MWTRAELKEKAKQNVSRSYWALVLVSFILSMLTGGGGGGGGTGGSSSGGDYSSGGGSGAGMDSEVLPILFGVLAVVGVIILIAVIIGILWVTFLTNPVSVGGKRYLVEATYKQMTVNELGKLFMCFSKDKYMNVVKILFFRDLYVGLWSLLFVIPGIVKSYEYYMLPYILAENPNISKEDAFRLSKEMMDGEKWNTFVLGLSFIGWNLLSIFTCGLLSIFYVNPYMNMTFAQLYETLKHRASIDYYDHSMGNEVVYSYGNPGAYSSNAPTDNPYNAGSGFASGEMFNPSAPIEDDLYQMPDDKE